MVVESWLERGGTVKLESRESLVRGRSSRVKAGQDTHQDAAPLGLGNTPSRPKQHRTEGVWRGSLTSTVTLEGWEVGEAVSHGLRGADLLARPIG